MKGGKLKQQTELWIREVEHATAEIKVGSIMVRGEIALFFIFFRRHGS